MTVVPVLAATAVVVLVPPVRKRALAVAGSAATAGLSAGAATVGAAAGVASVVAEGIAGIGRAALSGSPAWEQTD
jgi:hypothetical protein